MELGNVSMTKLILTEGSQCAVFSIETCFITHAAVYNTISPF